MLKMQNSQRGFTLVEIMIVIAVIIVIGAMAIPGLMRSRLNANEAAAIAALKAISAASVTYRTTHTTYPGNLSDLYDPSASPQYIDSTLASGTKQGYAFTVSGNEDGFNASANPTKPNITGSRYFFLDGNGVIRSSTSGTAGISDPAI